MKKTTILSFAAVLMLALSGCKDASVDISNGSEELFKVGNTKVTNDDIFRSLFLNGGYSEVNSKVSKIIYDKEVPENDEIKKEAKDALAQAKKDMGENFLETIKQYYGCENEDAFYTKVSLPNAQLNALTKKFLNEHAEEQITTYKPVKVRIIACTSEDNAKKALEAVQKGTGFEEAAKQYGKTDTYKGAEEIVNQSSGLPSAVWSKISVITDKEAMINEVITDSVTDAENPVYYVVKVTNTKALEEFKDEAIKSILDKATSAKTDAMKFYLNKYNFRVYDIDIYNTYKTNNPDYLVQDQE